MSSQLDCIILLVLDQSNHVPMTGDKNKKLTTPSQETTHYCIKNSHRQYLSFKPHHYTKQLRVFFAHAAALYTKKETESKANLCERHIEGKPQDQFWVFLISCTEGFKVCPTKPLNARRSLQVLKFG